LFKFLANVISQSINFQSFIQIKLVGHKIQIPKVHVPSSLHNILLHSAAIISTFACLDMPIYSHAAFAPFTNPFPIGFD
jgi:hypothetical protein